MMPPRALRRISAAASFLLFVTLTSHPPARSQGGSTTHGLGPLTGYPEGDLGPTGCFITYGFRWPPPEGDVPFPCAITCEDHGVTRTAIYDDPGIQRPIYNDNCRKAGPDTEISYEQPSQRSPDPDETATCTIRTGSNKIPFPVWRTWYPEKSDFCKTLADDPHAETFDGARYDLQAAGEFVGLESLDDDLEVQYRLEPVGRSNVVSYVTAAAARVEGRRIVFTVADSGRVRVDGKPLELDDGQRTDLTAEGDAVLIRVGEQYTVLWPDGSNLHVAFYLRNLNAFFIPAVEREGRLRGLFGDADGDPADDFRTRDGRLLTGPPEFSTLYHTFAESWRVRPDESLFDYAPGESTDRYTDRSMPKAPATLENLAEVDRARAEAACRRGGITEPGVLEDCIVDVGYSGDESFIASARDRQTPVVLQLPPEPMPEPIVSGLCRPGDATAPAASFRADAGHSGRFSAAPGAPTGEERWAAPGFRAGHDPLVVGDRVIAAREDRLAALEAATGELLWETGGGSGRIAGRGLVTAGGFVFAAWADALAAYDLETGAECWRLPIGPATAASFADGRLYVGVDEGTTGYVAAVEASSGRIHWRFEAREPAAVNWMSPTAPAVGGGSVFTSDGPDVLALDASSGELRWRATTGSGVIQGVTYADGIVYAPDRNRGLHALEAGTGEANWVWREAGSGNVHGFLALSDALVFVVDERHLHALDRNTGAVVWTVDGARQRMFHSANFAAGRLYVVAQDGALFVLDAGRGTELLQFPELTGPLIHGAASVVPGDGGFYAVLPDGKLHALR